MRYETLKKYAAEQNTKLLRGWKDEYGSLIVVLDVSGKKFGFVRPSDGTDWYYFFGIGSSGPTKDMPAGRGDYIIGQKVDKNNSAAIDSLASGSSGSFSLLPNKTGVSWSPASDSEKNALARLVSKAAELNSYFSSNGIIYTGDDKYIFGDDITEKDIMKFNPVERGSASNTTESTTTYSGEQSTGGNSREVMAFIPALSEEYRSRFNKNLSVGSTYRDAYNQALAMRYPLRDGDYDALYSHLGPDANRIKELISRGDESGLREAATIINRTSLSKGSHMVGKAIDIPFNPNRLSSADYDSFKSLVADVSKKTGIPARLNSEKISHFHIDVG